MVAFGMKVARPVATAPGTLALGKVTPDGVSVVWHEIVDHDGQPTSKYGDIRMDRHPRPLKGDKVPIPPEFTGLVP